MKKLTLVIVFGLSILFLNAQNSSVESEFSKPNISIGVVVEDLEKSVDFYTNIIGMQKTGAFDVDKEKAKKLGLTNGHSINVTVLKLENNPQATEWKLMSFGTKNKHKKQSYIEDGIGMQYITIFVNHLEPIIKRIEQNNIKILSGKPSDLGNENYFILVQDPDGTFIELIGPK